MLLHIARRALALLILLPLAASAADDDPLQPIAYVPEAIGPYHWPITTYTLRAQQYFDQGMQLRYGCSVGEATRSMPMARRLDPDCAICC